MAQVLHRISPKSPKPIASGQILLTPPYLHPSGFQHSRTQLPSSLQPPPSLGLSTVHSSLGPELPAGSQCPGTQHSHHTSGGSPQHCRFPSARPPLQPVCSSAPTSLFSWVLQVGVSSAWTASPGLKCDSVSGIPPHLNTLPPCPCFPSYSL